MDFIYESSTDDDSDCGSIRTNALVNIRDGSQMHTKLNTKDARSKVRDRIRQTENEWKEAEL